MFSQPKKQTLNLEEIVKAYLFDHFDPVAKHRGVKEHEVLSVMSPHSLSVEKFYVKNFGITIFSSRENAIGNLIYGEGLASCVENGRNVAHTDKDHAFVHPDNEGTDIHTHIVKGLGEIIETNELKCILDRIKTIEK